MTDSYKSVGDAQRRMKAIVIGASAGAIDALSSILPRFSAGFGLPVMIVVHIPADRKSALADIFRTKCTLATREVEDKEPILAGTVYFAPPDYHLLVEKDDRLSLSNEEPVFFSRPSVDVLFESAADVYGPSLIAVVLTGANQDGAKGLQAVAEVGGVTIVQRPETAQESAMPLAAIASCPGARVLDLNQIADYLCEVGSL